MDRKNAGSRWSSFFVDPKQAVKNIAILAATLFVVVYAVIQILPIFADKVETETALLVSVNDDTRTEGVIFRSEHILPGSLAGTLVTLVSDGERVWRGEQIAGVYTADGTAALQSQIEKLDKKIAVLEKSSVDADMYVTDVSKTDAAIKQSLEALYASLAVGRLEETESLATTLLVDLNKRDRIIHMGGGYADRIASLKAERLSLATRIGSVSTPVYADASGYYYGDVDGYESVFLPSLLDTLTPDAFTQLTESSPAATNAALGKIVDSYVWYLVCRVDKTEAGAYHEGMNYTLRFPQESDAEITMRLSRVAGTSTDKEALLIFRANTAPVDFSFRRMEEVRIIRDEFTGLAVPRDAIRFVDGLRGVYVLDGDIVRFRTVKVLFENEDYCVVDAGLDAPAETADEEETEGPRYESIALYDRVIVTGKNLFDGKILGL